MGEGWILQNPLHDTKIFSDAVSLSRAFFTGDRGHRAVSTILAVVCYSFTECSIVTPPVWIGLRNYAHLVRDSDFLIVLPHSLVYLIVTSTPIFLSSLLAIIVNRWPRRISAFRALWPMTSVPRIIQSHIGLFQQALFEIDQYSLGSWIKVSRWLAGWRNLAKRWVPA